MACQQDELLEAIAVEPDYAMVDASDGKTYLCQLIAQERIKKEGFEPVMITERKKRDLLRKGMDKLRKKGMTPHIIRKREADDYNPHFRFPQWDEGFTTPRFYKSYVIEFYRIFNRD